MNAPYDLTSAHCNACMTSVGCHVHSAFKACLVALLAMHSIWVFAQKCVLLEGEFLDEKVYLSLRDQLKPDDNICFKNIPGGQAKHLIKYSRLMSERRVHVYGFCNSLCAELALSAAQLILHKSQDPNEPTSMLIHGTFDMRNMEWHPSSLDSVEYFHDRLKIISKQDIVKALSIKKYGPSGLIISADPFPQLHPSKSLVHVCEDFPKKCRSLRIFDLKLMGISVEEN